MSSAKLKIVKYCFASILFLIVVSQSVCEIKRNYTIGFENVQHRVNGKNNTYNGHRTVHGNHQNMKTTTPSSRHNKPRSTLPPHRKPDRTHTTLPPHKHGQPGKSFTTLPPHYYGKSNKTQSQKLNRTTTVRPLSKPRPPSKPVTTLPPSRTRPSKRPVTTLPPPKSRPPSRPLTTLPPSRTRPSKRPISTLPPPTSRPPSRPLTTLPPSRTRPPKRPITTLPPPKSIPPNRLVSTLVPPRFGQPGKIGTTLSPPVSKPPSKPVPSIRPKPYNKPVTTLPPPMFKAPNKTLTNYPPSLPGSLPKPITTIPPMLIPSNKTLNNVAPTKSNQFFLPLPPKPKEKLQPIIPNHGTPPKIIYLNNKPQYDSSDWEDFHSFLNFLRNVTVRTNQNGRLHKTVEGREIEYYYITRDYYHNSDGVAKHIAVKNETLRPCTDGTTKPMCVPNTYSMCLSNGTVMCIAYMSNTVPCGNQSCIITKYPCEGYGVTCTRQYELFTYLPCISHVKILPTPTDDLFKNLTATVIDLCAVTITEPTILESPIGAAAKLFLELGKSHLNTLKNYTYGHF